MAMAGIRNNNVEAKLDRAMIFVQRVRDLPTLIQIMNVMAISPTEDLEINDSRSVKRLIVRYLNDPVNISNGEDIELRLDLVNNICGHYFASQREEKNAGVTKMRPGMETIDIPSIGPIRMSMNERD